MHRNATCPIDRMFYKHIIPQHVITINNNSNASSFHSGNPIRPETVQDDLFVASLLTEVAASPVVEKESSWKSK
jgi:hypothetical protein